MAIVTMTSEEIDAYMTPERMKMEEDRAKDMPLVFDPDCPPLTDDDAKRFHRVKPRKSAI
ncbi:hypothetical protein D081_0993 [Anaerovibrio sp. JC8]|uniref:hypothetical protein n=1 Tax=Anaerovibrio sp. JC8 TaxID=1240085 RepID=UPI000A0DAFB9|nr:hypothetical protein [Anaerovibrio sp. JC8]ORU00470.1 hypothetical protein D081_0993 [Anaerovibrio sp. JC8]